MNQAKILILIVLNLSALTMCKGGFFSRNKKEKEVEEPLLTLSGECPITLF